MVASDDAAARAEEARLSRMKDCVRQLLIGIGEDPEREGLLDTPKVFDYCCKIKVAYLALLWSIYPTRTRLRRPYLFFVWRAPYTISTNLNLLLSSSLYQLSSIVLHIASSICAHRASAGMVGFLYHPPLYYPPLTTVLSLPAASGQSPSGHVWRIPAEYPRGARECSLPRTPGKQRDDGARTRDDCARLSSGPPALCSSVAAL